jgi:transposase
LQTTAERLLAAQQEANQLGKELAALARAMAPTLLGQPGVGPVTAAQLLISWSHPGRLRSEAAFAMLAGTAPIEASSGQVVRHRLNRGGDRQLNRALHTIVMIRERYHQPTKRYVARRTAQGKSEREIRRCLIGGVSGARSAQESGRARGAGQGTAPLSCHPDGQFEFRRPWPRRAHDRLQDIAPARAVNKAPANRARSIHELQAQREQERRSMFVGWDWASTTHDVTVLDNAGAVVDHWAPAHTEAGLADTLTRLASHGQPDQLPVAIEQSSGLVVDRLLAAGHPVVPVHATAFHAARPRWGAAGAKSDPGDSYRLADYLRTDGHRLRRLQPLDDATRELQALVRLREDHVKAKVAASNQLGALLDDHWPGAKQVFSRLGSAIALAFLEAYPTPQAAARLGEARLAAFCRRHSYRGGRSPADLLTGCGQPQPHHWAWGKRR